MYFRKNSLDRINHSKIVALIPDLDKENKFSTSNIKAKPELNEMNNSNSTSISMLRNSLEEFAAFHDSFCPCRLNCNINATPHGHLTLPNFHNHYLKVMMLIA